MASEKLETIMMDLLPRSEEIASRWYHGAVHDPEHGRGTPEAVIASLREVVIEAIELLTMEKFGPSKARELGERISKLSLDGEDFLGRTHEILAYELTKDLNTDQLHLIHNDLTSLMANFTSGYFEHLRSHILSEERDIHDNLMKDLLIVDERLKKTNEELEAMVEHRTAELQRLNEELKKEIGNRKQAEEYLKQRETLLSVVFDTTFLWTGLLDPDGRLLLPNKTSLDFMGLKKEQVIGHFFWDTPWWDHSDELKGKIKKAVVEAKKGVHSRFEVYHVDPKGHRQEVQFSIRPVKNHQGEIIYLIPEGILLPLAKE
jgi:PAS domain S-box-containing protein